MWFRCSTTKSLTQRKQPVLTANQVNIVELALRNFFFWKLKQFCWEKRVCSVERSAKNICLRQIDWFFLGYSGPREQWTWNHCLLRRLQCNCRSSLMITNIFRMSNGKCNTQQSGCIAEAIQRNQRKPTEDCRCGSRFEVSCKLQCFEY